MDMPVDTDQQPEIDAAQEPEVISAEAEASVPVPAEPDKPTRQRERQPKKGGRKSRQTNRNLSTLRQVADRFAACGRCSYFWAGYKVLFGEEAQETAVNESESGWLTLQWNSQMPDLLHKSYGIRMDVDYFHYEGCCKECRRRFVYRAAENADEEAAYCAIEISPHGLK